MEKNGQLVEESEIIAEIVPIAKPIVNSLEKYSVLIENSNKINFLPI